MSDGSDRQNIYERMIEVRPSLMWVSKRTWSEDKCEQMRQELDAQENVAWRIDEGEAEVEVGGKRVVARAGEWVFPMPGRRVQSFRGPLTFVSVAMEWVWSNGRHVYEGEGAYVVARDQVPWMDEEADQLLRMVGELWQKEVFYFGYEMVTMEGALRIFAGGVRWAQAYVRAMDALGVGMNAMKEQDGRVERVLKVVREQVEVGVGDLMERLESELGISSRQMQRLVQQETGMSVSQYRDRELVHRATRMLVSPMMRVKEIAAVLGFVDLPTFSKWFVRQVGVSPRAYRKRFQEIG